MQTSQHHTDVVTACVFWQQSRLISADLSGALLCWAMTEDGTLTADGMLRVADTAPITALVCRDDRLWALSEETLLAYDLPGRQALASLSLPE
jgi:hypothetical protein